MRLFIRKPWNSKCRVKCSDAGRHDFEDWLYYKQYTAVAILQAGGLPKSPLFAKSDNLFFLKVIDAEIEFVKDNNKNVSELIVHFKGENQVAKKIK